MEFALRAGFTFSGGWDGATEFNASAARDPHYYHQVEEKNYKVADRHHDPIELLGFSWDGRKFVKADEEQEKEMNEAKMDRMRAELMEADLKHRALQRKDNKAPTDGKKTFGSGRSRKKRWSCLGFGGKPTKAAEDAKGRNEKDDTDSDCSAAEDLP